MAGEVSGVLDNDDAAEPSLDDWLGLEHVTQEGGEWTGTATVSGACGGLTVRTEGIEKDVIIGLVNDVIICSVGDVIVKGVDGVIFETAESMNDEVNGINANEFDVDGIPTDGEEIDGTGADDVGVDDVTADDVTVEGAKDDTVAVNTVVVAGDEIDEVIEIAADSPERITGEVSVEGAVVTKEPGAACVEDVSANEISAADDVTFVNEFTNGDTTTHVSNDGDEEVETEAEKSSFSSSSISVLEFGVSVSLESLTLALRCVSSLVVLSGCSFSAHSIF
jgi:hypothetical protein